MAQTLTVRQRVQAASGRIRALKRTDRLAAMFIVLGGIGIVASVLGILVVIAAEAWPLFKAPESRALADLPLDESGLVLGVDEYQRYVYQVLPGGRLQLRRLSDGAVAGGFDLLDPPGTVTAASRSLVGDDVAAGTADGRVSLVQIGFRPRYENQRLADVEFVPEGKGTIVLDDQERPIRRLDYREDDSGARAVAGQTSDREVSVWLRGDDGAERRAAVSVPAEERVTTLALGGTRQLVAGTDRGLVHHWLIDEDPPRLANVSPVSGAAITALAWILGDVTYVAGTSTGEVSAWFPVRLREEDPEPAMVRAHVFPSQGTEVRALGASTRDKSFFSLGADGSLQLHFLSSERTLLRLRGRPDARGALITPKGDGLLLAQGDGHLSRFEISVPHPEITWQALFGKVWYEGYGKPEHVWQSTGATNDFETKFSLYPLVFGTLKGTLYALLFAIPLAVLGALYTSQFVHPTVRARVKPTVEVMAALPSVVIGFVAGLYLAPLVERHVVPVMLMLFVMPLLGTMGVLIWGRLPLALVRRLKPGMELALILPLLLLGGWVSLKLGPALEAWLLGGDFRLWLGSALGLTYDQRNCLVVGLAMGFAVIPIIFTIADDAFSAVPGSLTAGSLALGASRWQTALRVVLPTASPGVFSAIMIGFGRAVGETMIVLMATGNTPVLDWSIFNGMRTLSANIAVEIPEAPYGGTLYRVLFLAAAMLFLITFAVNTVAEVIRQRLRERYRAL
jgi:phosphate transport system permease protein